MPLMGMVRCAGCNRIISRVKRVRAKGRKGETYRCGVQNMTKEFGCCPQTIEESEIETAILTMLKKMAAIVADREIPEMRSATLTAEAPLCGDAAGAVLSWLCAGAGGGTGRELYHNL